VDIKRVLFASCHSYIDPASGASISTQALLELFASRGIDARALTLGVLDYAKETSLPDVIDGLGVPYRRAMAELAGRPGAGVEVLDLVLNGVRVTLMPTSSSFPSKAPDRMESAAYLDLFGQVLDRFRPQVVMTYGGQPVCRQLISKARLRGAAVVFHLRNFAYEGGTLFDEVNGLVVTSAYSGRHYNKVLERECKVIPNSLKTDQIIAADPRPQYLTYVNPEKSKGVVFFARIAAELDRRRPDIPLLVVESRGLTDGLADVGIDLSGLRNLHRMANTPDPRDFYRVSRVVLMPSLWRETFGRVAAEAMANGIPVLASDRGALPETVGAGGFVFHIPARYTPSGGGGVPTAAEVEPWIEVIERLWDDPEWEAAQRARARAAASWWDEDRVVEEYLDYFRSLAESNFLSYVGR
jgi:glycosyltransferase involved in cell wall biosynthesis